MTDEVSRTYKRLNFDNRIELQKLLSANISIAGCSRALGFSPSTIAREIKRNRIDDGHKRPLSRAAIHLCIHRKTCSVKGLCKGCWTKRCASCQKKSCHAFCDLYLREVCRIKIRAPYCCNGCSKKSGCPLHRFSYDAKIAQKKADKRLVESRAGINMTEETFEEMVAFVWPLIKEKGQSVAQVWMTHEDSLPCSKRSFYRYVEGALGNMRRIHMPKASAYKVRKRLLVRTSAELAGHNFADFMALPEEVRASAVEMDCVMGTKDDDKCLLTLFMRPFRLLLIFLLPEHNLSAVKSALDWLEASTSTDFFKAHFSVLLTDRGQEFLQYEVLETGVAGEKRCHIYYCDAQRSNQKGMIENAHLFIRRVLPKGTSFEELEQIEVAHIASHINSVPRASLGGVSPLELAHCVLPKFFFEQLGLCRVYPDEVWLKPSLIKTLRCELD